MRSLLFVPLCACTSAAVVVGDTGLGVDSAVPIPVVLTAGEVTLDVVVSDPTRPLPDPEFEPGGRRLVWQDGARNVWIAEVDPATGALTPTNGRGVRVDRGVASAALSRNGPEWVSTSTGSRVVYVDLDLAGRTVLAQAWEEGGAWRSAAIPDTTGALQPFGTQVPGDPDPLIRFRSADDPPRTGLLHLLDPADRWVQSTEVHSARFGLGLRVLTGVVGRQVWQLDEAGARARLTSDDRPKAWPFLVPAPERGGERLLVAARARVGGSDLVVWRRVGGVWTEVRSVPAPPTHPWIDSPEPFVWAGRSYAVYVVMQGRTADLRTPSEVWVASLDPDGEPVAQRVCGAETLERRDPEAWGGWVWYTEATGDRRILHRCEVPLPG